MNFAVVGFVVPQVYQQPVSEWVDLEKAVEAFRKMLTKEPEMGPRDWSPRTGECFCKKH